MPFTELVKLGFDPTGVTGDLKKTRDGLAETQAGVDALKTGFKVAATAITSALTVVAGQHDAAFSSIASATGSSGEELVGLQGDYFQLLGTVRNSTEEVGKAIGDLNTHTGLAGKGLQDVARLALQAGLNTDILGQSFRRANVPAEEQADIIDTLTVLGQRYGVDLDDIQKRVGNWSTRMDALGLSMKQSVTLTAIARSEGRLMGDVLREIEAGTGEWEGRLNEVLPTLGDVAGATEAAYKETETLKDQFFLLSNRLKSYVTFNPQVLQAVAGVASGIGGVALVAPQAGAALKLLWSSALGPIGLVSVAIVGVGGVLFRFRDRVAEFLGWLLGQVSRAIQAYVGGLAALVGRFSDGLAEKIRSSGAVFTSTIDGVTDKLKDYGRSVRDARDESEDLAETIGGSGIGGGGGPVVVPELFRARTEVELLEFESVKLKIGLTNLRDVGRQLGDEFAYFSDETVKLTRRIRRFGDVGRDVGLEAGDWPVKLSTALMGGFKATWNPETVGSVVAAAFAGGGGGRGASVALGSQLGGTMGTAITSQLSKVASSGIGGVLRGALISAVPVIGPLLGQLGGWMFDKLFNWGGPDKAELAGREAAEWYRQGVVEGLSPEQLAGARAALNDGWESLTGPALVIAVRDAKIAAGATVEEAQRAADAMFHALHQAEKEGPEAVARVVAEINAIIGEGQSAAAESAEIVTIGTDALTGQTKESLEALEQAAVKMYERTGQAALKWRNKTVFAINNVIDAVSAFAAESEQAFKAFDAGLSRSSRGLAAAGVGRGAETTHITVDVDGKVLGETAVTNERGARVRNGELV